MIVSKAADFANLVFDNYRFSKLHNRMFQVCLVSSLVFPSASPNITMSVGLNYVQKGLIELSDVCNVGVRTAVGE